MKKSTQRLLKFSGGFVVGAMLGIGGAMLNAIFFKPIFSNFRVQDYCMASSWSIGTRLAALAGGILGLLAMNLSVNKEKITWKTLSDFIKINVVLLLTFVLIGCYVSSFVSMIAGLFVCVSPEAYP